MHLIPTGALMAYLAALILTLTSRLSTGETIWHVISQKGDFATAVLALALFGGPVLLVAFINSQRNLLAKTEQDAALTKRDLGRVTKVLGDLTKTQAAIGAGLAEVAKFDAVGSAEALAASIKDAEGRAVELQKLDVAKFEAMIAAIAERQAAVLKTLEAHNSRVKPLTASMTRADEVARSVSSQIADLDDFDPEDLGRRIDAAERGIKESEPKIVGLEAIANTARQLKPQFEPLAARIKALKARDSGLESLLGSISQIREEVEDALRNLGNRAAIDDVAAKSATFLAQATIRVADLEKLVPGLRDTKTKFDSLKIRLDVLDDENTGILADADRVTEAIEAVMKNLGNVETDADGTPLRIVADNVRQSLGEAERRLGELENVGRALVGLATKQIPAVAARMNGANGALPHA